MRENENNKVTMCGTVYGDLEYSHEVLGEKFYKGVIATQRYSEVFDFIPFIVSERIINVNDIHDGKILLLKGQYRSFNEITDVKSYLRLFVFVQAVTYIDHPEAYYENTIDLIGHVVKSSACRQTPIGRKVTELIVAVERAYGRSDYIPLIVWGRCAQYISNLDVGKKVKIYGRIQSREYNKKVSEKEYEKRVAYEVSVKALELLENQEENNG